MGSLLVLFGLLMGIASEARAAVADRAELQSILEDAKGIVQEISIDVEYARALELGIASAYAFSSAYDCFYAGWPSQLTTSGGRRFCARPTSLPHYQKHVQGLSCGGGTMACNPMFFGKGAGGSGLCADISSSSGRSTAFSQCEAKANALGSKKYDFIDELRKDPGQLAELRQTLQQVKDVCVEGKVGTQKGTQMCSKFIAKLNKIEGRLGDAPAVPVSGSPAEKKKDAADAPRKSFTEMLFAKDPQPVEEKRGSFMEALYAGDGKKTVQPTQTAKTTAAANTAQIANQTCVDCEARKQQQQEYVPGGFMDILMHGKKTETAPVTDNGAKTPTGSNWLTDGMSDSVRYEQIRKKFMDSGKCHRWERIPAAAKEAFKTALFYPEIKAFSAHDGNAAPIAQEQALANLRAVFGWNEMSAEYKVWADRAAALPPASSKSSEQPRAKFQADLLKLLKNSFGMSAVNAEVSRRAAAELAKRGISDCDFPSKAAFTQGLAAIRAKAAALKGAKPDIVTIADRSLNKNQERVTTFNLKTGEVLFQSQAGFGDADGDINKTAREKDVCSNRGGDNASPHGVALAEESRAPRNGTFQRGTFLKLPGENGGWTTDRGVAFHEGGSSGFDGYTSGRLTKLHGDALNSGSPAAMRALLNQISVPVGTPVTHNTNGCVSIPNDTVRGMQDLIEKGSYIYFHCPASMIR